MTRRRRGGSGAMAGDRAEPEGGRDRGRGWGGVRSPLGWVRAAWEWLQRADRRWDATWLVGGYRAADAGDLATVVAFNGLVALVPTTLLLVSVAGLLLRQDRVLTTASEASLWALPRNDARDALGVLLAARRHSARLG